jgi:hypothetical protein
MKSEQAKTEQSTSDVLVRVELITGTKDAQCGNCLFFWPSRPLPKAGIDAGFIARGQCRAHPEPLAKETDYLCGEWRPLEKL